MAIVTREERNKMVDEVVNKIQKTFAENNFKTTIGTHIDINGDKQVDLHTNQKEAQLAFQVLNQEMESIGLNQIEGISD